jgi:uncharacterized protein YcbK (DUF882 family)
MRTFVVSLLALALLSLARPASGQEEEERALSFYNTHTRESLSVVYRRGDVYDPDGLARINRILRDTVCGEEHPIDPRVLDYLYDLLKRLKYEGDVQIICGYRTAETNAMLHKTTSGVVLGSQHVKAQALDFRLAGIDMKKVWETAKAMKRGGAGYYKTSNFVHIDTGRVRSW